MIAYVPRKNKQVVNTAPFEQTVCDYCEAFGVTVDQLRSKHPSGMPLRKIGDVKLAEMRRCLSIHFFENSYLSTTQIAKLVGCGNHTTVLFQLSQARGHRETGDKLFLYYYNVLMEVIDPAIVP